MKPFVRTGFGAGSFAVAAVLAACNAGMTPSAPLAGSAISTDGAQAQRGKAAFIIRVPRKTHDNRRLNPKYISPSTKSMTVVTRGAAKQTFNLIAKSPNCSEGPSGLTCQESAALPIGSDTVTVTLYDQTSGKGNALAAARTSVHIAPQGVTQVPITLDGVVATVKVLVNGSTTPSVPVGSPTTLPVDVEAFDADGNLIIPPGGYSSPITLTNSDPSGITSLAATSFGAPGTSTTLSYNGDPLPLPLNDPSGNAQSAQVSFIPSVRGTPMASAQAKLSETGTVFSSHPVPTNVPRDIVTGPDGALWFTQSGFIGRATANGTVTEYSIPTQGINNPRVLTNGPDGALWFTQCTISGSLSSFWVGRVTTSGAITEYSITPTNSTEGAYGITAGPDKALWFVTSYPQAIWRMTTSGSVTQYPVSASGVQPYAITAGPDGALWFTGYCGGYVGRITTAGSITSYSVPGGPSDPFPRLTSIIVGPDDALWLTDVGGPIDRITTSGQVNQYLIDGGNGAAQALTVGRDGALWFENGKLARIGRMTTTGVVSEYPIPKKLTGGRNPQQSSLWGYVTTGADGAIWFTDSTNLIGRIP